jgi:hypothetical protein
MSPRKVASRKKDHQIAIAKTRADVRRCFPVMRELRPHFKKADKFVQQVLRQQRGGYLLAFLEAGGEVRAVAGYRFLESLFAGKFLYVDDLVTCDRDRSRGFGGVQRFGAHRFYLLKRMNISSYHFRIGITDEQ